MHHALQIQEIISNICMEGARFDLPALAGTCRTFKEPALDALWHTLLSPSPLARCLPEATQPELSRWGSKPSIEQYSFTRSLTQPEWNVLRSYALRVRILTWDSPVGPGLNWKSVKTFLDPSTTEPLFPNLRDLHCHEVTKRKPLLNMPFPSLIYLSIRGLRSEELNTSKRSLELFSKSSPNIQCLSVSLEPSDLLSSTKFDSSFSTCICQWQCLRKVECNFIALNATALAHLSNMSLLTRLTFKPSVMLLDQITSSNSPFIFPNLHALELHSDFLDPISRLLPSIQVPVIAEFSVFVQKCPSKSDVSLFLANVETLGIDSTIQRFHVEQPFPPDDYVTVDPRPTLHMEDLKPCLAFHNLRHFAFDLEWKAALSSSDVLVLASAWPRIKELSINGDWGWQTTDGGITPSGLLEILEICPLLQWIAVAVDVRGYTEFHRPLGPISPRRFSMNVVDSAMEPESVSAVTAFLAYIACSTDFYFYAWNGWMMEDTEGSADHWHAAYRRVDSMVGCLEAYLRAHFSEKLEGFLARE